MESLRDIKQQIKAINSTKQMMLTMKMVSSARIRSAQQTMLNGRPFAQKMASLIDNLRKDIQDENNPFRQNKYYRYFDNSLGDPNKVGLLLITGDKGLCGAFNAVTLREVLKWIRENKDKEKYVFIIGKKGADFVRRIKMPNLHIVCELINVFPHISYAQIPVSHAWFSSLREFQTSIKTCLMLSQIPVKNSRMEFQISWKNSLIAVKTSVKNSLIAVHVSIANSLTSSQWVIRR